MYLSILAIPIIGSIIRGLRGRSIGVTGAHIITTGSLMISAILSIVAFYEVGLCGSPVSIELFSWIDSEFMLVSWGFLFDSLTVSMLLPVLIVSSLVHLYSISYMSEDPHNQRFFSYLSIFTFFMLILVRGDNYFVMFVGWEGKLLALNETSDVYYMLIILNSIPQKKFFHSIGKIRSNKRIGPHNKDVIECLIGSLLGDAHMEKRGDRVRFKIEQTNRNVEYLMWFHNFLSTRGYCSILKPVLFKRIRAHNKIYYGYKFNSFTFSSLNWLYDGFYINHIKCLPIDVLYEYLTPIRLAIWFMDDGSRTRSGFKIATNCFIETELYELCLLLKNKYNLDCSIHKDKHQFIIYIKTKSALTFVNLVEPYIIKSIKYKLGIYSQSNAKIK
jgi:hypothetical protein